MNKILFATFFVIFGCSALSLRFKRKLDEFEPYPEECLKELNSTEADRRLWNRFTRSWKVPYDNETYNKIFECYWIKKGHMDKDGNVNFDKIRKMILKLFEGNADVEFVKAYADSAISECRDIKGGTLGEKAVRTDRCILYALKNNGQ